MPVSTRIEYSVDIFNFVNIRMRNWIDLPHTHIKWNTMSVDTYLTPEIMLKRWSLFAKKSLTFFVRFFCRVPLFKRSSYTFTIGIDVIDNCAQTVYAMRYSTTYGQIAS